MPPRCRRAARTSPVAQLRRPPAPPPPPPLTARCPTTARTRPTTARRRSPPPLSAAHSRPASLPPSPSLSLSPSPSLALPPSRCVCLRLSALSQFARESSRLRAGGVKRGRATPDAHRLAWAQVDKTREVTEEKTRPDKARQDTHGPPWVLAVGHLRVHTSLGRGHTVCTCACMCTCAASASASASHAQSRLLRVTLAGGGCWAVAWLRLIRRCSARLAPRTFWRRGWAIGAGGIAPRSCRDRAKIAPRLRRAETVPRSQGDRAEIAARSCRDCADIARDCPAGPVNVPRLPPRLPRRH